MNNQTYFLILTIFLSSCNFTSRTHERILVAQKYIKNQEYQKAVLEYKKILERSPKKDIAIKIFYQLGDLHSVYLDENNESLPYYKKVLELSDDPLWLVKAEERLGEINFTYLKNYDDSALTYNKLSNFTPKLAKQDFYQYRYAQSLFYGEEDTKASEVFLAMTKIEGHQYKNESFFQLGLISFNNKKWLSAIDYWESYIDSRPGFERIVRTRFLMANAYEVLEKLKKAYNIYYSILGEYPNTEVIKNKLESIYKRRISRKR